MNDEKEVFDVSTTYPKGYDPEDPQIKDSIHRINLMVFLLEGLDYKTIYTTPLGKLVGELKPRLDSAHNHGLLNLDQCGLAKAMADKLVGKLGEGGPTLKGVLTTEGAALTPTVMMYSLTLRSVGISLPYLGQPEAQRADAITVFADGFLNDNDHPTQPGAGNMTDRELYTTARSLHPKVHDIIQQAKAAAVMENKPNNYACRLDDCVHYDDLYCSLTELGGCSLQSDPYPD